MRRAAALGLVFLALAAGFLLWGRATRAAGRAPPVAPATPPAASAPRPAPAGTQETVDIRGSIHDTRGLTFSEAKGSVQFKVDGSNPVETEISDGEWTWTAPKGSSLTFEAIDFGGRKAIPLEATMQVPDDGDMKVPCRWLVPTLLRVIGEKGEDLDGVEIGDESTWRLAPDETSTSASSTIELNGAEGAHTYSVRARDHAWSRVTVFVGFGGERIVRLVRAGILDMRLVPYEPDADVILRLSRDDAEFYWDPDDSGRARIEGLPPGDYEIRAQIGSWRSDVVAAEVKSRIEPGATTELTLSLPDLPALPEPVPFEGTIAVAPGWSEEDEAPSNCMTPSITAVSLRGDDVYTEPEDGRWSMDPVPPGRYCIRVHAWTWFQAVDVGPLGNTDVRLAVPPPCDVEVHLVDGKTGKPVPDESGIQWCVKSPEVDPGFWLSDERGEAPVEPGIYRFRAPIGRLVVGFWHDLLRADDIEVDLKPGLNRVDLKTAWNLSFDVGFKDGAMPVPVDKEFSDHVRVAALDGDGELDCCGTGDPCRVWVTKPGRYRVSFPSEIEGYEPIPPIEVEVATGRIPRIEVALQRRER